MPDQVPSIPTILGPEEDRYASLRLIKWWRQDVIQAARVMVVGAGALGNEVLKNLALLGVGHILIVDFDTVVASNLTRSVLFRAEDGGKPKASVAAQRLQEMNPDVDARALLEDITANVGSGLYRRMDVVIGCLDNRAARLAVGRACRGVQRAWIDGALDVLSGLVRTFLPRHDVCYECSLTEQDYALLNLRYSCAPGFTLMTGVQPTIPMTASIIAALQVQEAIKLLHGQSVTAGLATYFSGETLRFTSMRYVARPDCPAHMLFEPLIELPFGTNDLTVGQFLDHIQNIVRDEGILYLPGPLVLSMFCPVCQTHEAIYRPYETAMPRDLACPVCGNRRIPDIVHTVSNTTTFRDVSLARLGIPALHIIPVRSSTGWHYFELSGDEQILLSNWYKGVEHD